MATARAEESVSSQYPNCGVHCSVQHPAYCFRPAACCLLPAACCAASLVVLQCSNVAVLQCVAVSQFAVLRAALPGGVLQLGCVFPTMDGRWVRLFAFPSQEQADGESEGTSAAAAGSLVRALALVISYWLWRSAPVDGLKNCAVSALSVLTFGTCSAGLVFLALSALEHPFTVYCALIYLALHMYVYACVCACVGNSCGREEWHGPRCVEFASNSHGNAFRPARGSGNGSSERLERDGWAGRLAAGRDARSALLQSYACVRLCMTRKAGSMWVWMAWAGGKMNEAANERTDGRTDGRAGDGWIVRSN